MFNPIASATKISKSAARTVKAPLVRRDQKIRHSTIQELKSLGLLKEGVC